MTDRHETFNAAMPTTDLERLLRDPAVSTQELDLARKELTQRLTKEFRTGIPTTLPTAGTDAAPDPAEPLNAGYVSPARILQAKQRVSCLAISSDGARLATGGPGSLQLWDLRTGQPMWEARIKGWRKGVGDVMFSANRTVLAGASDDGFARVWNAADGQQLLRVTHSAPVLGIAISYQATRLATASDDRTARVWDTSGAEQLRLRHDKQVTSVAFSPSGSELLTGSADATARLWNLLTGAEIGRLRHKKAVTSVEFNPDGSRLATSSQDGSVRIWTLEKLAKNADLQLRHPRPVVSVAWSPTGRFVATACSDGSGYVWNVTNGAQVLRVEQSAALSDVTFSPDGSRLVTGCEDGSARIWDISTIYGRF